jgi:hypothetical protein
VNYRQIAWLAAGIFLLAVEGVAGVRGDPLLTDAMRAGARRWLLWPALFGTLCGHFFGESTLPQWAAWFIVPLGLAVLARDLFVGSEVAPINHLAFCLLFVGLGAVLWGSR